jgi:hypothetical protein
MTRRRRIEDLTEEHEAYLAEWRARWTDVALCTAPADRDAAELAIAMAYRAASLGPPRVVWCGSPLSLSLTRAAALKLPAFDTEGLALSVRGSVESSTNNSLGISPGPCVEAFVGSSIAGERRSVGLWVWEALKAATGPSARMRVLEQVSGHVSDFWRAVWPPLTSHGRVFAGNNERYHLYGQHDAGILSFFDYFREVCGLRAQTERARGLDLLARSAGWAAPHANLCWVSERHNVVRHDENGLPHCATGPAIAYPDGWGRHFWHGLSVPPRVD